MDSRQGRDSCPIEELGHYDPLGKDAETQTVLNVSRVRYWLSVGAQPSHKVQCLLNKKGVKKPAPGEPWQVAETPVAVAEPDVVEWSVRAGTALCRAEMTGRWRAVVYLP